MAEQKYTKYEKARMIGARALQISMGAPSTIKLSKKDLESIKYNPLEIAKMEFEKKSLPVMIRRPRPGKKRHQKKTKEETKKKE